MAVLLFLLRLLKTLDFQPKLALITSTIGNAFSDMIHFVILFVTVLYAPLPSLCAIHPQHSISRSSSAVLS